MLRRLCFACGRWLTAPVVLRAASSGCIAVCLATCCLQVTSLLGTSLPVTLAVTAALALGFAAGSGRATLTGGSNIPGITAGAILHFFLAAWIVVSPSIIHLLDLLIGRPGMIALNAPGRNAVALFVLCTAFLGLPAFLTAKLAGDPDHGRAGGPRLVPFFFGAALGLALWSMGIGQLLGPYYCALVAAGLGLALSAFGTWRRTTAALDDEAQMPSEQPRRGSSAPAAGDGAGHVTKLGPEHAATPGFPAIWRIAVDGVLAIGLGSWLAGCERLLQQLLPGTVYLSCAEVIGLCLGVSLGCFLACRWSGRIARLERTRLIFAAVAALLGVALIAAFPALVELSLYLHSYVSSTMLLLAARGALVAVIFLPAGAAAAVWAFPAAGPNPAKLNLGIPGWLTLGALGYSGAAAWALRQFPVESILIGSAWWIAVALAPLCLWRPARVLQGAPRARFGLPAGRKVAAAALFAAMFVVPLWRHNCDARLAAKILFTSSAAYGYRIGLAPDALIAIDDGRHLATVRGQRGTYTVWRFGGHQLQIRENGIPCGVVSTDPAAFPKFLPDVMQSALPLVLHGRAERMLQLGLGSSESLTAALAFPLPEIVCLESDPALVRLVRDAVAPNLTTNPLEDDRLLLAICEPALGLAAAQGRFDVISSSPPNVALTAAQPYFTAEFYQRVRAKLSPEGVFCQRLQHIDLGPRPMQQIVATLRSVFRDVIAIEVAPGDMLLAATNASQGLIRPELTARFELPHVRRGLADSGIDWTIALNLDAVNDAGLRKFSADARAVNSAGASRLALSLPREVMRWGAKQQELFTGLAKVKGRLLDWIGEEAQSQVLVRRLAEVQGQMDLMTKYSDQYWAYRASLRDQVKEKSRSKIQLVSAVDDRKQLHPEDQRRLEYFTALGEATRTHSAADIDRLVQFAEPYDPLISYFVHEEAAEMYSRSPERDFVKELRHRLYATFYSSPRDASLRNVVGALKLLREYPEAEPDPATRWDDLNALLQALKLRWEARAGMPPANARETINDIDTTILAVEQTFKVMDRLTTEAGLPEDLWKARRAVLERTLIRPVKSYEIELLPHLNRREAEERGKSKKIEDGE